MKKTALALFAALASVSALASEGVLVLQIQGEAGHSVAEINAALKKKGIRDRLPESIRITPATDVSELSERLSALVAKVYENEGIMTNAYGIEKDMKEPCFEGSNQDIPAIYENMVDVFVSDQFGIMATSTKDPDHVGIKYDETDSGSEGSWINVERCE
jgi:hypothetical protein